MKLSQGTLFINVHPGQWTSAFQKEPMTTGPFMGSGNPIYFLIESNQLNTTDVYIAIQDSIDGQTWETRIMWPQPVRPGGCLYVNPRHHLSYARVVLFSVARAQVFIQRNTEEGYANPGQVLGSFFPPDPTLPDPNIPNTVPREEEEPEARDCSVTIHHGQKKPEMGTVIAPGFGEFWYPCGEEIPLIALPMDYGGWEFWGWSGHTGTIADPTAEYTTIIVDGNYHLYPDFGWGLPGP